MTTKLTITSEVDSKTFEVMLNPTSINHDHSISYDSNCDGQRAIGALAPRTEFSSYQQESLSFEIIIDGTGAVPSDSQSSSDVATQIDDLKNLVYRYNGDKHEPDVVTLTWGTLDFKGRLDSLKLQYTLFGSDGTVLRAKVSLSFKSYLSAADESKLAKRSSPDLTHTITVKAGDTLPLLCEKVYQNSSYYIDVARFNNLTNFRRLTPGQQLQFPPLS